MIIAVRLVKVFSLRQKPVAFVMIKIANNAPQIAFVQHAYLITLALVESVFIAR